MSRPHHPARKAGIGLRAAHYQDLVAQRPPVGWIEVHPENYFGGGLPLHYLEQARALYPLSFHAVGLSPGSACGVDRDHIARIRALIDRFEPFQVSDHASWSASGNAHLNDLLPLPYTVEALHVLCRNIDFIQEGLGRRILIENPSTYVQFTHSEMTEAAFLNEAARRTGCGLLIDVNNAYVQERNHGLDACAFVREIKASYVGEIHVAGHRERELAGGVLCVDTHDCAVRPEVWDLYALAAARFPQAHALLEWDSDLPPLAVLVDEALKLEGGLRAAA